MWTTIKLCVLGLSIGALVSIPVAAGRLSKNRALNALAYGYSYFFRGTPIIAQLFLVYYGAGQFVGFFRAAGLWWFFRDAFNCAVFTFALNTAAYQAEILYGAFRAVPVGSWEASPGAGAARLHHPVEGHPAAGADDRAQALRQRDDLHRQGARR